MFNFLRKKGVDDKFNNLNSNLSLTFSNVKKDMDIIKQWITHLNERSKEIDRYKEHLTLTKEDVKNLNTWIEYLENRHNDTHSFILDLHKNDKELFGRVKELEEFKKKNEKVYRGQVGTL